MWNPVGVLLISLVRIPACASRRWALEFNAFGVRETQRQQFRRIKNAETSAFGVRGAGYKVVRAFMEVFQYAEGVIVSSPASRSARWESFISSHEPQRGSTPSCQNRSLDVEPRWGSIDFIGSNPSVRFATLGFGVQRLRRKRNAETKAFESQRALRDAGLWSSTPSAYEFEFQRALRDAGLWSATLGVRGNNANQPASAAFAKSAHAWCIQCAHFIVLCIDRTE
jgi:hypothetical protein